MEIDKAKEYIQFFGCDKFNSDFNEAMNTLMLYIKDLEHENKMLKKDKEM